MKSPARALRFAAWAAVAALCAACSGGGNSGAITPPPPPPPPAPTLLFLTTNLATGIMGVPYTQTLRVSGGSGARTFTVTTGALPAGLALDAAKGIISGTPLGPAGSTNFTVTVADSSSPPLDADEPFTLQVIAAAVGRNDAIADATPLGNGTFAASISPSGDPNGLLAPDEDYYSVTTTAASTVTVDINAVSSGSALDSVIEIVGATGVQLQTCEAPDFTSACLSDDEDTENGLLDSLLEVRVPADTTFYIHVVDWGSNARPDKLYDLVISGVN